jgi:predicted dienelactone hydrolase
VVAHGFQLPPTQYTKYVQRLATHGYVALTADFKADLFNTDHVANAQQVLAGIDWAADEPVLAGLADTNNVGLTGHSLGGKLAIFGAVLDERVRASITLDPVDGAQMCSPQKCPDVSDMLPTDIPLGFVGETLDGSGGFMPCAPAANNYLTFYAAATAPALAVTVNGANHMSFLDDVDSCGFVCSFCNPPTLANDVVNALSRAYVVAFYGRHLKGEAGYDAYLTGATAQARYVETGLVDLDEK